MWFESITRFTTRAVQSGTALKENGFGPSASDYREEEISIQLIAEESQQVTNV